LTKYDYFGCLWKCIDNKVKKENADIFDCCKQSLTRLSHPSIHPSSKVFSQDRFIYNIFFHRL
jgi:hypothetical protein